MMQTRRIFDNLPGLIAAAALLAGSAVARADINGYWVDAANWSVTITGMPDIDQRRMDLPNFGIHGLPNNGNMYCVPASGFNLLNYVALHGYPNEGPGPYNFQTSPLYNLASDNIAALGGAMGTDPITGTASSQAGIQFWLDHYYPGLFATVEDQAHDNHCPVISDIAAQVIQSGAIANVYVGWYQWNDAYAFYNRVGGHSVSLAGASSPGLFTPSSLSISDPANETPKNLLAQSPYHNESYNLNNASFTFGFFDADNDEIIGGTRTEQKLVGYGSGYLDGYLSITPKWAFTATDSMLNVYFPLQLAGSLAPAVQHYSSANGRKITSLALDPTSSQQLYSVEGSNVIWKFDTLTGQSSGFVVAEGPKQLALGGRDLDLYVLTAGQLLRMDRQGRTRQAAALPVVLDAFAVDSQHNLIAGIAQAQHRLYLFAADTLRSMGTVDLPAAFLEFVNASPAISINPHDGSIYLHQDGSRSVWLLRFTLTGAPQWQRIGLQGVLTSPIGLFADERGQLFLSDNGCVRVFLGDGSSVQNSRFAGLPSGRNLEILKPFSNFDPQTMKGPAYYNVLPPAAGL